MATSYADKEESEEHDVVGSGGRQKWHQEVAPNALIRRMLRRLGSLKDQRYHFPSW